MKMNDMDEERGVGGDAHGHAPQHEPGAFDDLMGEPSAHAPSDLGPIEGAAAAGDAHAFDDGAHLDDDIVDAEPVAKKKGRPVVLLGVLALVVVTVVGVIGSRAMKAIGGASSAPQMAQPEVIPVSPSGVLQADQGLAPVAAVDRGVFGGDAGTPAATGLTETTASVADQAASNAAASLSAVATGAQMPVASVAASAVQAPVAESGAQGHRAVDQAAIDQVSRRVDSVESAVKSIETKVDAIDAKLSAAQSERRTPKASSGTAAKRSKPAPAKKSTATAAARKSTTKPAASRAGDSASSRALAGLNLRAVYPTAGPDMQAWVAQGEQVRVVSKGSYIDGATVLEVKRDVVLTDRGPIR